MFCFKDVKTSSLPGAVGVIRNFDYTPNDENNDDNNIINSDEKG